MVKGVHKKIIEVKSPGGDYFEKAIFYLKPGITQLPPEFTDAAAQMLLEELQPISHKSTKKKIAAALSIALIAGIVTTAIILLVI